jgi:hypothetical protein
MFFRGIGCLSLLVFLLTIFGTVLPAASQSSSKKIAATSTQLKKEWAIVDGFRSAKFGMGEKQLLRAIAKDFKIPKSKLVWEVSKTEKTKTLTIRIPKLIALGGPADIVYILGYKSRRLIHVNIDWGKGTNDNISWAIAKEVLHISGELQTYFTKKRYQEGYLINGRKNDSTLFLFRGRDKKGRMILLRLLTSDRDDKKKDRKDLSLELSYIADPDNPDLFNAKEKR